jgi:hypothetical protein
MTGVTNKKMKAKNAVSRTTRASPRHRPCAMVAMIVVDGRQDDADDR